MLDLINIIMISITSFLSLAGGLFALLRNIKIFKSCCCYSECMEPIDNNKINQEIQTKMIQSLEHLENTNELLINEINKTEHNKHCETEI